MSADVMEALKPATGPQAWRGDELGPSKRWLFHLSSAEVAELEEVGARFVHDDPDLRFVEPTDYPLPVTAGSIEKWKHEMDHGCGVVLTRGLRSELYSDALSAAIFFVLGLHIGEPMRQNELGDALTHILDLNPKDFKAGETYGTLTRSKLNFHSDSSDVVALMCLRSAMDGGASILISGATIYNEVLRRRPDLAHLLFEPWHYDWRRQDPRSPQRTYSSPMCSWVDGVFSMYAGSTIIRSAQAYEETPRMTKEQYELLDVLDEVFLTPGLPLEMDFRPGDIQWLLNYAALHSRTEFRDFPEPALKRHLTRLWLKRDSGRPLAPNFGRHVVLDRHTARAEEVPSELAHFHISQVCYPRSSTLVT